MTRKTSTSKRSQEMLWAKGQKWHFCQRALAIKSFKPWQRPDSRQWANPSHSQSFSEEFRRVIKNLSLDAPAAAHTVHAQRFCCKGDALMKSETLSREYRLRRLVSE
jgi:hypothetical protein